MATLYDKTGREILPGDVLKVFHFGSGRGRRHYMHKQAIAYQTVKSGDAYLKISHLNRLDDELWVIGVNYYLERLDDRTLAEYEIVQSVDCKFEQRPRRAA